MNASFSANSRVINESRPLHLSTTYGSPPTAGSMEPIPGVLGLVTNCIIEPLDAAFRNRSSIIVRT